MKQKILDKKAEIATLAKKHGLDLVLLFGSQASGKTHASSDIDVAVYGQRAFRPIELAKMQYDFSKLLRFEDVELVDIKSASPLLLRELYQNSILLYQADAKLYDEMKIYFFKRYIEAKPLIRLRARQLEASLK